jgi:hypothetical protein
MKICAAGILKLLRVPTPRSLRGHSENAGDTSLRDAVSPQFPPLVPPSKPTSTGSALRHVVQSIGDGRLT